MNKKSTRRVRKNIPQVGVSRKSDLNTGKAIKDVTQRIYALEMRIAAPYDLSMRMARLEEGIRSVEARYIPHGGTVSPTLEKKEDKVIRLSEGGSMLPYPDELPKDKATVPNIDKSGMYSSPTQDDIDEFSVQEDHMLQLYRIRPYSHDGCEGWKFGLFNIILRWFKLHVCLMTIHAKEAKVESEEVNHGIYS